MKIDQLSAIYKREWRIVNKEFNVLLVAPNFIEKWNKLELACKENLSINALGAYLQEEGYNVTVINAQLENWDNEQIISYVKDTKFDLIGISCSPQKLYLSSKDFIQKARKYYPNACIVIGGVFPSLSYKDILNDLPQVDFVSTGEGEIALSLICEYLRYDSVKLCEIPGLAYRHRNEIKINKTERIENLDLLPFPIRDRRTFSNIKGVYANVIAGRGCYGNCSFCSIHSAYEYRNSDSSAPGNSCPFTPCLKHTQSGAILFSFHKSVVGKRIQPEAAGMAFTIIFRLDEKFHNMGREAIYIKRYEKAYRIHVRKQFQYLRKILPAAEGYRFFSDTRKK